MAKTSYSSKATTPDSNLAAINKLHFNGQT
jgi:hypothetical protein